ncbi:hypothetical protein HGN31_12170 [Paracoccus sanguinis]|uniref:Uncharacterized protein n=2 Tax=Paracoccus TaxID=265 RepID=A0A099GNN5_9RHOB|nr:hypothetical protein IX54_01710 [Paracoccus sanguinis]KGJ23683.1 hypothetical protein IX56_00905 [Paracoccus sanguinis]QJD18331.1 hypothetical protein HGN31_12170 [Paracoccus sanguinis]
MMAIIRLAAILIAIEALFYVLISLYLRSLQRERLEETWDERHPDRAGDSPERRVFVRRSMVGFERTLRARLVALVFVLPTVALMVIIYFVNYHR